MLRIAINGFGRIGRLTLRALQVQKDVQVVAINDLADPATLAHLFKYDSTYGPYAGKVHCTGNTLVIDGHPIAVYASPDPAQLPWQPLGIQTVLEATGRFASAEGASAHLRAGALRVLISAPASGAVPTVVLGVNEHTLRGDERIVSNASCTTNCLAPLAMVLDEAFGIEQGYMHTVHAYTADQRLQDAPHHDLRRARAAAQSIIPTSTGAARAVGQVLPRLQGRLDGMATRVPVGNGSMLDCTLLLQREATAGALNEALRHAAQGRLQGILAYTEDPIVSADIIGNLHSCVVDGLLTSVQGRLAKVVGWYDNEGAYAQRLAELIVRLS